MKKIAVMILSAALLLSSSAFAADIDVNGLSLDELVDLRAKIEAAINEKLGGAAPFGTGVFICGQDIKEGYYEFTATDDGGAYIFIYDSQESRQNGDDMIGNSSVYSAGEISTFSVHEGNCIEVNGAGMLRESKPSWAP